ncbi:MAG: excalibur calcium-binding domain-containing protein [Minisyncoccia bacterium]
MNFKELRGNKKARLWVIGGLIVLAGIAFFFAKTTWAKVLIGGAIGLLMLAFGMEVNNKDFDVVQLVKTGSFAASQIQRDPETGNLIPGSVDAFCTAQDIDYNCDDFRTQPEAQTVYDRCKGLGKNMDVYRLDGDKDGTVCEARPKTAQ